MKQVLEKFSQQCQEALSLGDNILLEDIDRIFICGMGGSAFAGDVVKTLCENSIPIEVSRDYDLPAHAGERTLVIAVSYSGNTEETLSAAMDAWNRGCKVIGVCSGGKLEQFCLRNGLSLVKVPSGIQPRNAMGYLALPIVNILERNGFIREINWESVFQALENPLLKQSAQQLAEMLYNKVPIIYSSQKLACVSYGWKTRINENSKIHAFAHQIPELNHNELVAYTKKIGNFHTVIIRDEDDSFEVKKRIDVTQRVIQQNGSECDIVDIKGATQAARIFYALHLADWVSYFLALKYGIDPEPVEIIENFKKALKD